MTFRLLAALLLLLAPLARGAEIAHVRVLAVNDFHGQLEPLARENGRAGGAAALATLLKERIAESGADRTLVVSAGDLVGASPASSGLLQDEPSVEWLDLFTTSECGPAPPFDPACRVVATLGNHELDEGPAELRRLLFGGNHAAGPFLRDPWPGSRVPWICANVQDEKTGSGLLPPHRVVLLGGVRVGVVGALTASTPFIVLPRGTAGLRFQDPAEAVNRSVKALQAEGVRAVVVLLHEGGRQAPHAGPTRDDAAAQGAVRSVVARLDDEVDLVVSGHSHSFTNARLPTAGGTHRALVTQAWSRGTAFAVADLDLDAATGDVVASTARIENVRTDAVKEPDAAASALVARAEAAVAPRVARVVARSKVALTRAANAAGESSLGDLVADAHRAALGTDLAFTNPGGLRADLPAGDVTWGDLFAAQPFGNVLLRVKMTGAQVRKLLEQQWAGRDESRVLAVSGLSVVCDPSRPAGKRIVSVRVGGKPLRVARTYSVAVNEFLAAGGDEFSALAGASRAGAGPLDLDALLAHVQSLPQPLDPPPAGRIVFAHERKRRSQRGLPWRRASARPGTAVRRVAGRADARRHVAVRTAGWGRAMS